jgi:hypothetical protein
MVIIGPKRAIFLTIVLLIVVGTHYETGNKDYVYHVLGVLYH